MQAPKTSWKLTFTAWSMVLAVWCLLMITLDRDSLLILYELGGRHQRGLIIALGSVMVLPLLLEAARNVPRVRRIWQSRRWQSRASRNPATASWRSEVPATTPRRFRTATRTPPLSARERAVVEQGQLAFGQVEHHGELCSVRFDAPWGETLASLPVLAAGQPPPEGTRAPLLYEPHTSMGVAPTLMGLEFVFPDPSDERPSLTAQVSSRPGKRVLSLSVHATLHPVERLSRYRSTEVGQLTLTGGLLTLALGDAEPIDVRISQPLRIDLSAHLRVDGEAELCVMLEPSTDCAYRAGTRVPLCIKTQLPQSRIDRQVPRAWTDTGYLTKVDFDLWWAAIIEATDDRTLTTRVAL